MKLENMKPHYDNLDAFERGLLYNLEDCLINAEYPNVCARDFLITDNQEKTIKYLIEKWKDLKIAGQHFSAQQCEVPYSYIAENQTPDRSKLCEYIKQNPNSFLLVKTDLQNMPNEEIKKLFMDLVENYPWIKLQEAWKENQVYTIFIIDNKRDLSNFAEVGSGGAGHRIIEPKITIYWKKQ
ncbi:hypothetical protein J4404_02475 [Candidatus Woesearchaeota archaeon]|nr:hypothetical protein [Candidatus Woesearchaeota archaeon]